MSLIDWQEDYSVGVKELDNQHKKMFDLINGLYESMKEVKDMKYREEILQELDDYGKLHLETEEKYFDEFDYPDKKGHKAIHDSYRNKIKEFMDKKTDVFLSYDIIDFLEDWWLGHIVSMDRGYRIFFNEKGIK